MAEQLAAREDRGQLGGDGGLVEHRLAALVADRHVPGAPVLVRLESEAGQLGVPGRAVPESEDGDLARLAQRGAHLRQGAEAVDDANVAGARDRLESQHGLHRHRVRRRKASQQLPELEAVEELAQLVPVVTQPARALDIEPHRDVADDGDQPLAEADRIGALPQRVLDAALGQLVETFQQRLDRAEVLDQLGGRLLPHPRHSRHVVRGVAAQRLVVDELRRLEAVALAHLVRSVDEGVGDAAPRHEGVDARGDQLQAVEIAGDDRRGQVLLLRLK